MFGSSGFTAGQTGLRFADDLTFFLIIFLKIDEDRFKDVILLSSGPAPKFLYREKLCPQGVWKKCIVGVCFSFLFVLMI